MGIESFSHSSMIVRLKLKTSLRTPEAPPQPDAPLQAPEVLRLLAMRQPRADAPVETVAPDPNLVTPREMVQGITVLLAPACAIAYALALWRIGEDMGWARQFAIRDGLFSHWQVWFGLGALLSMAIFHIRRGGENDDDQNQATS